MFSFSDRGSGGARRGCAPRHRQRERAGGADRDRSVEDHLWREEPARPARARRLLVPHRQMGRQGQDQASGWEGGRVPGSWIGRYILDGTAIADEGHGPYPDGTPFLGITFRQYDQSRKDVGHRVSERLRVVSEAAGASRHWIGRRERPHRHDHLGITRHRRPRALCGAGRRQLGLSAGLIQRRWTAGTRGPSSSPSAARSRRVESWTCWA